MHFNPRPSCEGRPKEYVFRDDSGRISIHAPHARGDAKSMSNSGVRVISIHAPHARGDPPLGRKAVGPHFNPRPSCEGRPTAILPHLLSCVISIHAPHARGDSLSPRDPTPDPYFNPRPSCEGRRHTCAHPYPCVDNFNPRPSCEGRLRTPLRAPCHDHFNPRPSCEGRRHTCARPCPCENNFNPRPSCEGRQVCR